MIKTTEIIPVSLEHALLATRVVAALQDIEYANTSILTEGAFRDAATFLRSILDGQRFSRERRITPKSSEYAFAYGEAIMAIRVLPRREVPGLSDFVESLISTADALDRKSEVAPMDRETLSGFFQALREIASGSNQKPIETLSVSR